MLYFAKVRLSSVPESSLWRLVVSGKAELLAWPLLLLTHCCPAGLRTRSRCGLCADLPSGWLCLHLPALAAETPHQLLQKRQFTLWSYSGALWGKVKMREKTPELRSGVRESGGALPRLALNSGT